MSIELIKIQAALKGIILLSNDREWTERPKVETINLLAKDAQELLSKLDKQEDDVITEQALQDCNYAHTTDYDKNSKFDEKYTVQITTYKIPISISTHIECTFGELYENGGWEKHPVNVELIIESEAIQLNYTKMSEINQLKQLLSIKKGE